MSEKNCNDLLQELKEKDFDFGHSLRIVRINQGLTIRKVAETVDVTATYISDIERGNNKPPNKQLMEKIFDALDLQDVKIKYHLYDLAAEKRGGVPEDIVEYIKKNNSLRMVIRTIQHQNGEDGFWAEYLNKIQM